MLQTQAIVAGPTLAASSRREFTFPQLEVDDLASQPQLVAHLSMLLAGLKRDHGPGDRALDEIETLERTIATNPSAVKVLHDGRAVAGAVTTTSFKGAVRVAALVVRPSADMDHWRAQLLRAAWDDRGTNRTMLYTDTALGSAFYSATGAELGQGDAAGNVVYLWHTAPVVPRR